MDLHEALNFTDDDDLAANRGDRLGPTQQGRMTTTKGRSQVTNLVFGAVFLVMLVVIGFYVLPMYIGSAASEAVPSIVGVLIAVGLIIVFTIWRRRRKLSRMDGAVLVTEGEASARDGLVPVSGGAMRRQGRLRAR